MTDKEREEWDQQQIIYRRQVQDMERLTRRPSWFATHKPLWAIKPGKTADAFERTNTRPQR